MLRHGRVIMHDHTAAPREHLINWPLFPIPFPQWGKGYSFYNTVWLHQTIIQRFPSAVLSIFSIFFSAAASRRVPFSGEPIVASQRFQLLQLSLMFDTLFISNKKTAYVPWRIAVFARRIGGTAANSRVTNEII